MLERMAFLSAAENRDTFFRRISFLYPTLDPRYQSIEFAYDAAKDAFRGKYRDDNETRYFEHIRAVTLIVIDYLMVKDHEVIIAALLHDIVEDIPSWSVSRVKEMFGERVALLVEYLTKPPKEEICDKSDRDRMYHSRFQNAPRAFFMIKMADRLHNLMTLWNCTEEKKRRKIEETKLHYLPYASQHLILYHEMLEVIERLESCSEVK